MSYKKLKLILRSKILSIASFETIGWPPAPTIHYSSKSSQVSSYFSDNQHDEDDGGIALDPQTRKKAV